MNPMQQVSANYVGPRAICTCDHTGDGAGSHHAPDDAGGHRSRSMQGVRVPAVHLEELDAGLPRRARPRETVVNVLADTEVFDMLAKHTAASKLAGTHATGLLEDFKTLGKSREHLRQKTLRLERLIDEAHEALTKAKRAT